MLIHYTLIAIYATTFRIKSSKYEKFDKHSFASNLRWIFAICTIFTMYLLHLMIYSHFVIIINCYEYYVFIIISGHIFQVKSYIIWFIIFDSNILKLIIRKWSRALFSFIKWIRNNIFSWKFLLLYGIMPTKRSIDDIFSIAYKHRWKQI